MRLRKRRLLHRLPQVGGKAAGEGVRSFGEEAVELGFGAPPEFLLLRGDPLHQDPDRLGGEAATLRGEFRQHDEIVEVAERVAERVQFLGLCA